MGNTEKPLVNAIRALPNSARASYRLCPHVVVVVRLVCVNDPWGYVVEPLMPDRSKVRCQTKRDTGVYAAR